MFRKFPADGRLHPAQTILAAIAITAALAAAPSGVPAQTTGDGATQNSVLDRIRTKMRDMKTEKSDAEKWFENLDLDKSGDITKQELYESVRRRFEKMDTDKDQFVSKLEYHNFRKDGASADGRFGILDSNKDGRLDMSEFASPADWRFDRIDRNLDGKISRPEAERLFDRARELRSSKNELGKCFYVDRQVIKVDNETAERLIKKGYARADCEWTPDTTGLKKTEEENQAGETKN